MGEFTARFYLGVDGGQSSTTALIADETGRVVGHGRGGPCNHVSGSEARSKFFAAVGGSIAEACAAAGLDAKSVQFTCACVGFSGGAEDKEAHARELIRSKRYRVTHDAEIALAGATAGEAGIICIAGTGSMAFGRNVDGRTARAGGWGYVLGDDGGAFDIVRRGLRAALRYEEGWGARTTLRDLLLAATGAANANDLMHLFYTAEYPRTRVASLAPLVTRSAAAGDAVSIEIIETAARELAALVAGVYRNLFHGEEQVVVAHTGGVFRSALLLAKFRDNVLASIGCPAGPARLGPAAGALLEALRMDDNRVELSGVPESEK